MREIDQPSGFDPFSDVILNHLVNEIKSIVACEHRGYQHDVEEIINWWFYPKKVGQKYVREICGKIRKQNIRYSCDPDKPEET